MAAKKILCQFDVQAVTSLSNPGAGYVGFSAKADGLYQKIGVTADLRLLTTSDAANYQPKHSELTAIAGVGGDVGFLRKTDVGAWTLDTSTYALSTHTHAGAYEPVLGNPATNGHILSSTTAGVRSWGALPLASSTIRGGMLITGSTPAPGTLPVSLYNESPYISLTSSAIEYVLNSASITSHKHDTLYAKLAGLSTQAFSTANLTLGNSTGNAPILTLYGSSPTVYSTIKTTSGNLHIDAYSTYATYLNYYAGSGGVIFGNGATGLSGASVSAAGLITAPALKFTTGAGAGKILTSDADGDATWETPATVSIPAASENTPGTVEIATQAEVLAMTDMLRSITPWSLANAFPNSTGNNGYISLPIGFNERLLIQYGSFSANGNGTVSFPLAFPYYCHSVVITAGDGIARIPSRTRFGFTWNDVQDAVTSANPCYWMAIGK